MTPPAVAGRRLQFCAGPQSMFFYACAKHQQELLKEWNINGLFYAVPAWPVVDVDPNDANECDLCRAEEGE